MTFLRHNGVMKTMLPTEVRNRWKQVLREVSEGEEEVRIHLKGDREVMMLPAELYESIIATLETLSDPAAMRAIRRHRTGKGKMYSLAEADRLIHGRA